MPMKTLCCAASPCRRATTVRQLPTRGEWWEGAVCVEHTDRVQLHWHAKIVAIQTEARPAVQSTQPADALHTLCTIHTISSFDGAALDASVMVRNVCRDLVFETSSHAACSHSDLGGCADGTAEALPARQTASIRCWHAPMQLSGLPRVFVHALAFSSTPSHADAAEFSSMPSHAAAAARALCSFHHSPRVRQLSDSRCSAARRGSTAPGRHGHQTTPR